MGLFRGAMIRRGSFICGGGIVSPDWSDGAAFLDVLCGVARSGDRRTVVGREGPGSVGLELGGFFDVPHRVSINKSASYGFLWNRIGILGPLIDALLEEGCCERYESLKDFLQETASATKQLTSGGEAAS